MLFVLALAVGPGAVAGQTVQGRAVDANNGEPVGLAGVFLLDSARELIVGSAADAEGYYSIEVPGAGEYYLFFQRLGYFENETPLLEIPGPGDFGVDVEMRPEPFRLDPLEVTVQNEELEDFLTLEFGVNPNSIFGYRVYQGIRVEEAKLLAEDNTDFLRELYVPVSHGQRVCIGTFGGSMPERGSMARINAAADAATPVAVETMNAQCGQLFLDGIQCRNEHIEEIDLDRIAVVVLTPGSVRLFTRGFEWTFKPNIAGACQ